MFSPVFVAVLNTFLASSVRGGYSIIGGEPAKITELPHQAFLRIDKYGVAFSLCGGSIISPWHILTAAHCADQARRVRIHLGTDDLSRGGGDDVFQAASVKIHENYNKSKYINDLAVIKLTRKINFSDKIQMISLAKPGVEVRDGTELIISGWGLTSKPNGRASAILRKVSLPKVSLDMCYKAYQPNDTVTEDMICAGGEVGRGAFRGDSGGALIERTKSGKLQVGIASWAHLTDEAGFPDVFTKVSKYYEWIENVVLQDLKLEFSESRTIFNNL